MNRHAEHAHEERREQEAAAVAEQSGDEPDDADDGEDADAPSCVRRSLVRVLRACVPRQEDAQPEREDHDVGHDHEWTAGIHRVSNAPDDRGGEPDRQAERARRVDRRRRCARTTRLASHVDGIVAGSGDAIATIAGKPRRCRSGVAIAEPPLPNAPDKKPTPMPMSIAPSEHLWGHTSIQRPTDSIDQACLDLWVP